MRRFAVAVAGVLAGGLALLASCTGEPAGTGGPEATDGATGEVVSPLADCHGLTAPPPDASPSPQAPGSATPMPATSLPCFTGGEPVALDQLRGPAVVNLWASWCPPCRKELPALQRFAERAAGRVHVIGVVSGDRPEAAAALAAELGVTFPALEDRDERLRDALAVAGLPATLLLDAAGQLRYVHRSGALDEGSLARLVSQHLAVVVTDG